MHMALSRANDRLKSGAFQEAEQLFKRILDEHPNEAEALHGLAITEGKRGNSERALELIESALAIDPENPKYLSNFSVFARFSNKLDKALTASGKAIALAPRNAGFWNTRGNVLAQAGRLTDAVTAFEKAVALNPSYVEAYYNLGNLQKDRKDLERAAEAYNAAICLSPGFFDAALNLGEVLYALRRYPQALSAFDGAVTRQPEHLGALLGLGKSLYQLGRRQEALDVFDAATKVAPENPKALLFKGRTLLDLERPLEAADHLSRAVELDPNRESYLQKGIALTQLGRVDDALKSLDAALEIQPDLVLALFHKTNLLRKSGRLDEALATVMKAIEIRPEQAELWNSLGNVAKVSWRLHGARDAFKRALELDPSLDSAVNNLAGTYKGLAEFEKARRYYDQSLELAPKNLNFIGNLLFCANYDPHVSEDELAALHREMAERLEDGVVPKSDFANDRTPTRCLRIGLVSGDLGRHPTGYFLEGVLRHARRAEVTYICYSNRVKEDDVTARLRGYADGWRPIHGLSTQDLCDLVAKDEIDILIDLSGYTADTRLDCFAHRPAPVQMTWLGSCHTTGMSTMDYIIMDPHYVRSGDEHLFTEEFIRLPDIRWVYKLRDHLPEVAPPPVLRNGHITFGSFNNLTKVNEAVITLWAQVLKAVPDAKMTVSWRSLGEAKERERIADRFHQYGIDTDRLLLTPGKQNGNTVFDDYGDVDIALDAFPFSGCITTCEALSMGVPIVTLPGVRPASRQTYGFLKAIGRDAWCAESSDAFVAIAAKLASDPDDLAAMRRDQRQRMLASPMCDAARFAGHLEAAFRDAWIKWCNS